MTEFIHYIENKHFYEHVQYPDGVEVTNHFNFCPESICFNKSRDKKCVTFSEYNKGIRLHTSYFVGTDWIESTGKAIYIEPKLNSDGAQTDYLKMLFSTLKHPEVAEHSNGLFEIKWESDPIQITQQQDLLTPLLVVQFLRVVQRIVRKGLKKSYYQVENNMYGRVKGKILVTKTINRNQIKCKTLNTFCRYDEFGLNGLENRLLKKALIFIQKYLPTLKMLNAQEYIESVFHYINPAFFQVTEDVSLHDIKHANTNVFYKEYEEGIRLAKLILRRFGYNISNTEKTELQTPPFWIDMSKLFELYVLGFLMDSSHENVLYQFKSNYGKPDYLVATEKKIIDAKYKPYYKEDFKSHNLTEYQYHSIGSDIRQLSGYSRDKRILSEFAINEDSLIKYVPECLIIYPDQTASENLFENEKTEISEFNNFYKQPVRLPTIA